MLCHVLDKIQGCNVIDIYGYFSRCQVTSNTRKFQDILQVISYIPFENVESTSVIISAS